MKAGFFLFEQLRKLGEHSVNFFFSEHSASTRRALGEHSASTQRIFIFSTSTQRTLGEHSANFFSCHVADAVIFPFFFSFFPVTHSSTKHPSLPATHPLSFSHWHLGKWTSKTWSPTEIGWEHTRRRGVQPNTTENTPADVESTQNREGSYS